MQMHFIKLPNNGKDVLTFNDKKLGLWTMAFIQ